MRCLSCGEDDRAWVDTNCPNPHYPGETLTFLVCRNCDYGINMHTEGECDCVSA